ncbi:uncharacterized protein BO72DRAFT_519280 [Aspergillus fijiensis CBS 313.89]|uniref:Uncharacterized protein n=1 Tax=Aspergillus fijiensis CBS 313.89 TaxID=1448319 RepID=A0A8G1VVI1_9EURO|nr:uncharacterized protein BO72DRAFT_519280 [Aspergillus fijiensis CBS 313.89]RAK73201.1 hypothetical protein BO72DRAFT_519280 [Aspergillus fijiensis CBS 313.89]
MTSLFVSHPTILELHLTQHTHPIDTSRINTLNTLLHPLILPTSTRIFKTQDLHQQLLFTHEEKPSTMAPNRTPPFHGTFDGVMFTLTQQRHPGPEGVVIDYVHLECEGHEWISLAGRLLQQHWCRYPLRRGGRGERRGGAAVICSGRVRLYIDEPTFGLPVALPFFHLNEAEWTAVDGMAPPLPVLLALQEHLMKPGMGLTQERINKEKYHEPRIPGD